MGGANGRMVVLIETERDGRSALACRFAKGCRLPGAGTSLTHYRTALDLQFVMIGFAMGYACDGRRCGRWVAFPKVQDTTTLSLSPIDRKSQSNDKPAH